MAISVTCGACQTTLRVKDEAAGLKARCPRCQNVITIPKLGDETQVLPAAVDVVVEAQVVGGQSTPVSEDDLLTDDEMGAVEELRPCPMCGEMVKPRAKYCRYCDEDFAPPVKGSKQRASGKSQRPNSSMPADSLSASAAGANSLVVTCDCGVAVRVPPERLGRQFACPQCQRGIALTVDGLRLPVKTLASGETGTLCQICQTKVQFGEQYVDCPECKQVHHGECWAEVGGCGTYGCKQAPLIDKADVSAQRPTSAWGDTKNCPVCRKDIKAVALRCRYCKTDFETADPLDRKELRNQRRRKQETSQLLVITVAVFIISLFGCPAPITLLVGLAYLLPRREDVQRCGPLASFLMYASLVISSLYTLLIGGAILFEILSG